MSIRSIRGWEVGGSGPGSCLRAGCSAGGVESSGCATAVLVKKLFGHLFSNYG